MKKIFLVVALCSTGLMFAREIGEYVSVLNYHTLDGKITVVEDGWKARWTQTEKDASDAGSLRSELNDKERELNKIRENLAQTREGDSSAEVEELREELNEAKNRTYLAGAVAVALGLGHLFRSRG